MAYDDTCLQEVPGTEESNDILNMKHFMITLLFFVADMIGLNRLFAIMYANRVRILMYHGVTSQEMPTAYWTQLRLENFKMQMRYVRSKCEVTKLTSIYNSDPGTVQVNDRKFIAAITFDDGYYNVYNEAWPVLKEMNLPVTIFVVTGKSESEELIWTDLIYIILIRRYNQEIDLSAFELGKFPAVGSCSERAPDIDNLKTALKLYSDSDRQAVISYLLEQYPLADNRDMQTLRLMTGEQIKEMATSGNITIASHSHNHAILSTLARGDQFKDIGASVEQLASWGIPNAGIFAYPNGARKDFNEHTIEALRKNGIFMAVTTLDDLSSPSDNPFYVKRINIRTDINIWEFRARISGLYYFIRKTYRRALLQKDRTEE